MTSTIKVDNIQKVSDGSSIIKKCGSTITVGSCGATVALASGASQTGFGTPSSSVLWCTTAKTSPFTAADQKGYFVNTSGGVVTVTLPSSPSAGDVVAIKDYANTFDTNNVTIGRGGSKINGICADATLSTESQSVTLIYVDGTKGWQDIQDSTSDIAGETYMSSSGGNATLTCGNFKTHVFTSSGTFTVNSLGNNPANNTVEYLVVAGGAGGGDGSGTGGGGAGGFRTTYPSPVSGGLAVTATGFPITVGAGGAFAPAPSGRGVSGGVSSFSTITSAGGGGGGSEGASNQTGVSGGSGGGGFVGVSAGSGNTPPVSPPQGNNGGAGGGCYSGGGGGGAGAVGFQGKPSAPGAGGDGAPIADVFFGPTAPSYGTPGPAAGRYFAGGGGGGNQPPASPTDVQTGGAGGGGTGAKWPATAGTTGTVNTGGGGGGGISSPTQPNGSGGSGFVAIRYRFQ